jgi:DNA-binding MarR family transcriptional regulator
MEYMSTMRMVSHESQSADPKPLLPKTISMPIVRVSALPQTKNISRPAISQDMEAQVSKGLMTRKIHPDGHRYVELELTREGCALLDAVFQNTRLDANPAGGPGSGHQERSVVHKPN